MEIDKSKFNSKFKIDKKSAAHNQQSAKNKKLIICNLPIED